MESSNSMNAETNVNSNEDISLNSPGQQSETISKEREKHEEEQEKEEEVGESSNSSRENLVQDRPDDRMELAIFVISYDGQITDNTPCFIARAIRRPQSREDGPNREGSSVNDLSNESNGGSSDGGVSGGNSLNDGGSNDSASKVGSSGDANNTNWGSDTTNYEKPDEDDSSSDDSDLDGSDDGELDGDGLDSDYSSKDSSSENNTDDNSSDDDSSDDSESDDSESDDSNSNNDESEDDSDDSSSESSSDDSDSNNDGSEDDSDSSSESSSDDSNLNNNGSEDDSDDNSSESNSSDGNSNDDGSSENDSSDSNPSDDDSSESNSDEEALGEDDDSSPYDSDEDCSSDGNSYGESCEDELENDHDIQTNESWRQDNGDNNNYEEEEDEPEDKSVPLRLLLLSIMSKGYTPCRFPLSFNTVRPPSTRFSERCSPTAANHPVLPDMFLPLKREPQVTDWELDPKDIQAFISLEEREVQMNEENDDNSDGDQVSTKNIDNVDLRRLKMEKRSNRGDVIREANKSFDNEYGTSDEYFYQYYYKKFSVYYNENDSETQRQRQRHAWFLDDLNEVWEIPGKLSFVNDAPQVFEMMKLSEMHIHLATVYLNESDLAFLYNGAGTLGISRTSHVPLNGHKPRRFNPWRATHIVTDMKSIESLKGSVLGRFIPSKIMIVHYKWLLRTIHEKKPIDPRPYAIPVDCGDSCSGYRTIGQAESVDNPTSNQDMLEGDTSENRSMAGFGEGNLSASIDSNDISKGILNCLTTNGETNINMKGNLNPELDDIIINQVNTHQDSASAMLVARKHLLSEYDGDEQDYRRPLKKIRENKENIEHKSRSTNITEV
ncbi:hypothetical protein BGZ76_011886 [Entomortierella beljakovae]|nr:hypothetical protein BGZ76_011886 [Entomortierella beljakovae]